MTATDRPSSRTRLAIAAGLPLTAVSLAYLASVAIDAVGYVGPFDRAVLGWTIVVPLLLAAPGLAALAPSITGSRRHGRLVIGAAGVFVAVFATYRLLLTITQVGCEPVTEPLQALPQALAVGLTAGAAFGLAAAVASRVASRASGALARSAVAVGVGAVLAAAGGGATLAVYAAVLPAASCPWRG